MTETSLSMTVSTEPSCEHTDLDLKVHITQQGNGKLLRVDQVKCKACDEVFLFPMGKRHSAHASVPMIPASSVVTRQQPTQKTGADAGKKVNPETEPKSIREQLGDGAGTELVEMWHGRGVKGCELCVQLARKMNEEGTGWCRENVDAIVEDCLPRVRDWFDNSTYRDKLSVWWKGHNKLVEAINMGTKAVTWKLDDGLRAVIKKDVLEATMRAESRQG